MNKQVKSSAFLQAVLLAGCSAAAWAQAPVIATGGTLNAADYTRSFAPGALVSLFGSNFAKELSYAPALPLPTMIGGVSVQVTDGSTTYQAPIYFAAPSQVNFQLPYGLAGPNISVKVQTSEGTSNADQILISPIAPRIFTQTADGQGRAVMAHADFKLVTRDAPAKPGEVMVLYMNSLGAVTPPGTAGIAPGDGTPGNPFNTLPVAPAIQTDLLPVQAVTFAGLAPGLSGVYQVNFQMPYDPNAGDAPITVSAGVASSQPGITIPIEPNGFYWVFTGSLFPNGQSLRGASGSTSALAFRHQNSAAYGNAGFNSWTKDINAPPSFSGLSGLALTLKSGNSIVYDNSGLETGAANPYYNNGGGGPDEINPGVTSFYSMSNYFNDLWTGYFRLTQPVTVTQIIGYFDGIGQSILRFDPNNIFNHYRMNIFSNSNGMPTANSFTGDVFSSENTPGTFSWSDTGVPCVYRNGNSAPIYRLVYTLKTPITLKAGEYWFGHDMTVPREFNGSPSGVSSIQTPASELRPVVPSTPIRSGRD